MPLLIHGGTIVADPCECLLIEGQSIAIDGDRIAAVGPADTLIGTYPNTERLDAQGCLILPGLIDAHTHLYSALSLGMPAFDAVPENFVQILERVWWRLDKALTPEDVYVSSLVGSLASLKNGVTTIFDHHASPDCASGSLDEVARATQECGLRTCLSYEVSDRDGSEGFELGVAENVRFIKKVRQEQYPRLGAMFGMHALFTLSERSIDHCRSIAEGLDTPFHLHVAEHKTEAEHCMAEHNQSVVEFLTGYGILGPGSIAAHGVHVDARDAERLATAGSWVIHNPKSNMGNGVGISPVIDFLSAGARVGIGSDGYFDIPEQMLATPLLQNLANGNPSACGAADVISMMYGHNARLAQTVFGLRFGRIQGGYAADLIIAPYDPPTPFTPENLPSHLLSFFGSLRAPTLIVAGKVILEKGKALRVDEHEVMASARDKAKDLWNRIRDQGGGT